MHLCLAFVLFGLFWPAACTNYVLEDYLVKQHSAHCAMRMVQAQSVNVSCQELEHKCDHKYSYIGTKACESIRAVRAYTTYLAAWNKSSLPEMLHLSHCELLTAACRSLLRELFARFDPRLVFETLCVSMKTCKFYMTQITHAAIISEIELPLFVDDLYRVYCVDSASLLCKFTVKMCVTRSYQFCVEPTYVPGRPRSLDSSNLIDYYMNSSFNQWKYLFGSGRILPYLEHCGPPEAESCRTLQDICFPSNANLSDVAALWVKWEFDKLLCANYTKNACSKNHIATVKMIEKCTSWYFANIGNLNDSAYLVETMDNLLEFGFQLHKQRVLDDAFFSIFWEHIMLVPKWALPSLLQIQYPKDANPEIIAVLGLLTYMGVEESAIYHDNMDQTTKRAQVAVELTAAMNSSFFPSTVDMAKVRVMCVQNRTGWTADLEQTCLAAYRKFWPICTKPYVECEQGVAAFCGMAEEHGSDFDQKRCALMLLHYCQTYGSESCYRQSHNRKILSLAIRMGSRRTARKLITIAYNSMLSKKGEGPPLRVFAKELQLRKLVEAAYTSACIDPDDPPDHDSLCKEVENICQTSLHLEGQQQIFGCRTEVFRRCLTSTDAVCKRLFVYCLRHSSYCGSNSELRSYFTTWGNHPDLYEKCGGSREMCLQFLRIFHNNATKIALTSVFEATCSSLPPEKCLVTEFCRQKTSKYCAPIHEITFSYYTRVICTHVTPRCLLQMNKTCVPRRGGQLCRRLWMFQKRKFKEQLALVCLRHINAYTFCDDFLADTVSSRLFADLVLESELAAGDAREQEKRQQMANGLVAFCSSVAMLLNPKCVDVMHRGRIAVYRFGEAVLSFLLFAGLVMLLLCQTSRFANRQDPTVVAATTTIAKQGNSQSI